MLSYQHIYHAGNAADVQKHALLAWMLDYLTGKDKPLTYIETHAGRGLYRLDAAEALKTGEGGAWDRSARAAFPEDHPYRTAAGRGAGVVWRGRLSGLAPPRRAVAARRRPDAPRRASPAGARGAGEAMAPFGAHVRKEEGLAMALALSPPTPRRGFVLIDPSWEVKDDYAAIPRFVAALHRKWNVGVVALWYPILEDARHRPMLETLAAAAPGALRHEVMFGPVRKGHRMVGSGLFVVNPPYGMEAEAARVSEIFDKAFR
jgi:23S rRNA (adenine2030-N6)-methyltransferase